MGVRRSQCAQSQGMQLTPVVLMIKSLILFLSILGVSGKQSGEGKNWRKFTDVFFNLITTLNYPDFNRPFPTCLVPPYQSEASCTSFHMKGRALTIVAFALIGRFKAIRKCHNFRSHLFERIALFNFGPRSHLYILLLYRGRAGYEISHSDQDAKKKALSAR